MAYIDDILIFSGSEEEYKKYVRLVLKRLIKYRLFMKLSKCVFGVKEVNFLGYRVGTVGISIDPSRVSAIVEWPTPQSFRDI